MDADNSKPISFYKAHPQWADALWQIYQFATMPDQLNSLARVVNMVAWSLTNFPDGQPSDDGEQIVALRTPSDELVDIAHTGVYYLEEIGLLTIDRLIWDSPILIGTTVPHVGDRGSTQVKAFVDATSPAEFATNAPNWRDIEYEPEDA